MSHSKWRVKYCAEICVNCSNVTPPKPVQKVGSGGGGSTSTAGKKKEFDPAQSLVFQMLQEENQRPKSGDVSGTMEEEPSYRRPQQQQQQQQQPAGRRRPQPQQQGSRLQELLERDRAASQQEDEEHLRYTDTRPQPPAPQHHASRPAMNQHRMQPAQPAGGFHHQESTYMKGSPTTASYHQQPINPSYEEYYQQSTPARSYYQNAPHMTSYYSSYGQESVPISDF